MKLFAEPDIIFEPDTPGSKMPVRSKEFSLGFDLFTCQYIRHYGGETIIVPLGIRAQFNPPWGAFIWDRSGMGAAGFHRFAGVIESDYVGLWGLILYNSTSKMRLLTPEKAVAQVIFQPVWMGEARQGKVNRDTDRGSAGFGSTDK